VTVRQAGPEDIDFIVKMGGHFHAASPYSGLIRYEPGDVRDFLAGLFNSGGGAVFIDRKAMCGGMIAPLYFNAEARIAVELFWYAKGPGRAVREAFERWAVQEKAELIQMSCLVDDREKAMRRLFKQQGYAAKELSLIKEI